MKKFVYQMSKNECGFASLKMLLANVYKDDRYLYIPHSKELNYQYSLLEIKQLAKENGLLLDCFLINDIKEIYKVNRPFLLIIKHRENDKHCILVKNTCKYFSYIYDPDKGRKITANNKLFKDINNGLEILKIEDINKIPFKYNVNKFSIKKEKVILNILEIASLLSFFFSAYFINKENYMSMPIIFIVIGVIFSLLFRIYIYISMKKFDEKYINHTFNSMPSIRKENYVLMHNCKKSLFSNSNKIFLDFASVTMINLMLIIDDYRNIYIICVSLFLVFIENFIFNKYLNKRNEKLLNLENRLLKNPSLSYSDYIYDYHIIKDKSYKIAKIIDIKRIIILFVLLMFTFMMSGFFNQANLNFILLNFTLCYFTYTMLSLGINDIKKYKDIKIDELKFYELINKVKK